MGRKKKPFIDKKKASKFHLVPRSQNDPLLEDPQQPQHVLKPEHTVPEDRLVQQKFYRVHYDDDYDYLQHLKEPGTAVMEPVKAPVPSLSLPGSVLGSQVMIEGDMGKVLPLTGPQPDWDPDIVAGLDNPEMNFDLDDQLEDNFILQANGGEPGIPVYVTDTASNGDGGDVWWMERGDFTIPHQYNDQSETDQSKHTKTDQSDASKTDQSDATKTDQSDASKTDQSDASSTRAVNDEKGDDKLRSKVMPNWDASERVGTFTDYSISSSVVPRNKGLSQLDERFETFMSEYDDGELGAPDVDMIDNKDEGGAGKKKEGGDQWLLDLAVKDFEKNFTDQISITEGNVVCSVGLERDKRGMEEASTTRDDSSANEDGSEGSEGEGERERKEMVMVEVGKPEWDCESILSTYSNLYNHPTKLVELASSRSKTTPTTTPITLSMKTGIPLGTIAGPLTKEKPLKQMPVTRPRNETADQRRDRKIAVKEERKFRRSEKKATKILFHSEQLKQEKLNFRQTIHTAAVV